jgi:hypothetical protein
VCGGCGSRLGGWRSEREPKVKQEDVTKGGKGEKEVMRAVKEGGECPELLPRDSVAILQPALSTHKPFQPCRLSVLLITP